MTRIGKAASAKGSAPFTAVDEASDTGIPATPPPEVLDALDRAARVMSELGRKNITVALEPTGSQIRVMLRHPGAPAGEEMSQHSLLNLLDGDTSEVGELAP
ncbi:MAG TPA: hypothetical protein VH063_19050 [Gaiellaceae bacterium]|nr:hypothetical protein [Gaiellaceae bacterium]